jgi:hypothetical protein
MTQMTYEQLCDANAKLADQLAAARHEIIVQRAVSLNGYQIRRLWDFVDSEDEAEVEVVYVDHERPDGNSKEGEMMPVGVYAWFKDYPEEGSLYLPEEPEVTAVDGGSEHGG